MTDQEPEAPKPRRPGGPISVRDFLPTIVEPRCHVCMSELRPVVDQMSVWGYRPVIIARRVQQVDPTLSRRSIERHLERHVDYEQEAMRRLLERRAQEFGNLHEEAEESILTREAILDRMMQKTWERLTEDGVKIPWEFGLKAIELSKQFEHDSSSVQMDQLTRQLSAIIQAVQEIVPEEIRRPLVDRAKAIYENTDLTVERKQIGASN